MKFIKGIQTKYQKKSSRLILGLVITVLFIIQTLQIINIPGMRLIEQQLYDVKVRASAHGNVDPRIVILDIDEKSLGELGRWPWNRALIGEINDKLFDDQGISVLGYDIVWAEPDPLNYDSVSKVWGEVLPEVDNKHPMYEAIIQRDPDQRFADSMKGRNIVLSMYFNNEEGAVKANVLPPPALTQEQLPDSAHSISKWDAYTGNLLRITQSASMAGHFNPLVDNDGIIRRLPLLLEHDGNYYQGLSLAMTRMVIGGAPVEPIIISQEGGYQSLEGIQIGPFTIPLQGDASAYVPYRGPEKSYEYVSVSDLLNDRLAPKYLENKLVIMGSSAPGLRDQRATPMGAVYPGIEVHANMISGILDNTIMEAPAYTMALAFIQIAIFGLLLTLLLPILGAVTATLTTVVFLAGLGWINWYFWGLQLVVPIGSPLLSVCLIYIGNLGIGYFVEGRLQRQMSGLFGQYVPAPLVKKMAENPEKYGMQGQESDLTVLFSDIRGFTGISEQLTPEELTSYINEYFNGMTKIIMDQSGTLDKYIGDAIMAFWGAPIDSDKHAYEAVKATFAIRNAALELAASFKERGLPDFNIGIGLNSGKMRVGDMGSNLRRSYTVMGDPVNLGSRLEGLSKPYGVGVLVSEYTAQRAPEFAYREIDKVRVKGKATVVAIFEPVAEKSDISAKESDEIDQWSKALECYFAQQWGPFEKHLGQLRKAFGDRVLYDLYESRVKQFKQQPPAKDWDGVTNFETK